MKNSTKASYNYKKNLQLGYLLIGLNNAFFWYAPWLLFLLKYITIEQVAIIEATGLATSVLAEVPTGALSDLIGKKRTLHLSFLFTAIGEVFVAFNTSYHRFLFAWIILNIGYSLYSGTMEAFMYDTLLSVRKEDEYPRVTSHSQAILNVSIAIASITGGLMFKWWIGLPFLATGLTKCIGLCATFFIDEPTVDSQTFSLQTFISQTKKGFAHLFQRSFVRYTILLLLFGVFAAVAYEILDDVAVVDWGYDAVGIGILYAAATFIAVPASYLYNRVRDKLGIVHIIIVGILILALGYLFSPWITAAIWTGIFLLRVFFSPIRNSAISELINSKTESSIRATTLSTYELLRKIPYVMLASFIGMSMDRYGIKTFSFYFAFTLLTLLLVYISTVGRRIVFMKKRELDYVDEEDF
ncbi:MFS transporter [Candidatus Woesebacteria bacterium]|nr:MFS transporter [Candidatus Woesebacteria bacterium]